MKRPLKYEELPEVFTPEILDLLMQIAKEGNEEWSEIYRQMSGTQFVQFAEAESEKKRSEYMDTKIPVSQEESDIADRKHLIWACSRWNDEPNLLDEIKLIDDINQGLINPGSLSDSRKYILKRIAYQAPDEKFTFIENGSPLLNNYPSPVKVEDFIYTSALHYIAYKKARIFIDRPAMERIPPLTDQQEICNALKSIHFYNKTVWDYQIGKIIRFILNEKFQQNESLKELLFSTEGRTIVYKNFDSRWGTGDFSTGLLNSSRSKWHGTNLMGELLTELRIKMMGHY